MDNYNYPEGSDNKYAPWNQVDDIECEMCGSENIDYEPNGYHCIDCGFDEDGESYEDFREDYNE